MGTVATATGYRFDDAQHRVNPCRNGIGLNALLGGNHNGAMTMCNCKPFCETHGRDEVAVEPDGSEYCNECAADGWSGELCHPSHESCDMLHPKVNEWERQFMCEEHAAEHVKFCEEAIAG